MTRDELTEFDDLNFFAATHIIERDQKDHSPILICAGWRFHTIVRDVGDFMGSSKGKDLLSKMMCDLEKSFDVVCLISEAWAVILENKICPSADLINAGVTPTNHPDRIEVLSINYRVKDLGFFTVQHKIIREGGKRRLERGKLGMPQQAEGRFVA
jgi:hypothetical protein